MGRSQQDRGRRRCWTQDLTLRPLVHTPADPWRALPPLPDPPCGPLRLDELERMIARALGSPCHPVCELIGLENTHNSLGGWVLSIDYLRQVGLAPPLHPCQSAVGPSPGIWPL